MDPLHLSLFLEEQTYQTGPLVGHLESSLHSWSLLIGLWSNLSSWGIRPLASLSKGDPFPPPFTIRSITCVHFIDILRHVCVFTDYVVCHPPAHTLKFQRNERRDLVLSYILPHSQCLEQCLTHVHSINAEKVHNTHSTLTPLYAEHGQRGNWALGEAQPNLPVV